MSEVMGIGIDLVEVARVEKMVSRWGQRFLDRVFTPREQADARGAHALRRLAGRLAVKEAALKALGTGLRSGRWVHLEVSNDSMGRPTLLLRGRLKAVAESHGIESFLVSLSYERGLAVAQVLALGE